jgi:hypothetical protein
MMKQCRNGILYGSDPAIHAVNVKLQLLGKCSTVKQVGMSGKNKGRVWPEGILVILHFVCSNPFIFSPYFLSSGSMDLRIDAVKIINELIIHQCHCSVLQQ